MLARLGIVVVCLVSVWGWGGVVFVRVVRVVRAVSVVRDIL